MWLMEIWHRIAINSLDVEFFNTIKDLGIKFEDLPSPGGLSSLIVFDITESDTRWGVIAAMIANYGASNIQETFFTDEEIRAAEWLRLICVFEQGYPQPKMPWPFKQMDRKLLCPKCAIYQQIAPMRIVKEPHLGRKVFVHTIWTNEVFCIPEVFRGLEEIRAKGYEQWDVLLHKSGQALENVHQLFIPGIASPGFLAEQDLGRTLCSECGTTKYYAHMRGIMRIKREALVPDTDFMLTQEWFGSGYLAWREILVSNRVAQLILDKGWQGVRLKVVEVV